MLDTWFSSALWPFATLGWPDDTPELRAFYPTDVLSTARDIIYLWVARMIMSGLEFAGDVPFRDVYIHSVIQAPDGRRMSKSLGTGIDPLDEISRNGADALRFGLLAMSSSQDVRSQRGEGRAGPRPRQQDLERLPADPADRGQATRRPPRRSRRSRTAGSSPGSSGRWSRSGERLDAYDFSHAALELYRFFWSELCDWYLEIVKPRLYEGEADAAGNLLFVLERTLAMAHPLMPFVTEEIWSYLPERGAQLVVSPYPRVAAERIEERAEAEVGEAIALTRSLRRWRELAEVPAGAVLSARATGATPHELVGRLARVEFGADGGEAIATVASIELLESDGLDGAAVAARIEERRSGLQSEVERAEKKLGNEGFVAKAPPEVVASEREKLERYRSELEELSG